MSYNALATACEQHGSGKMGSEVVALTDLNRVNCRTPWYTAGHAAGQFEGSPYVFYSGRIAGVLEAVSLLGS